MGLLSRLAADMLLFPAMAALVAELVAAATGHMLTPLAPLNDEPAVLAPFEGKVFLEKIDVLVVTFSLVTLHEAFRAVGCSTDDARGSFFVKVGLNVALAVLVGTLALVGVSVDCVEDQDLVVADSQILRKFVI
jgi:hypothetical protein